MIKYHTITRVLLLLIILSGFSLLQSCKKDEEIRAPKVETLDVSNISSAGAKLNGYVADLGTSGVKEAGFLYGTSSDLTFENSIKISVGAPNATGSITVSSDDYFVPNQTFFVKAYATPSNGTATVFGLPVSFIGKGGVGLPPLVSDFSPKEGGPGTVITIDGKNFDGDLTHVKVSFNNIPLEITQSSVSKIGVKIPNEITSGDFTTALKIDIREKSIMTSSSFHLLDPVINDFNPKEAKAGQSVTIDGQNFSADMTKVMVTFFNKQLQVTFATPTKIIVKIPDNLGFYDVSGALTVKVAQQTKTTVPVFHFVYPWKKLADFPADARYGAVSFVLNGVGYVGLGEKLGGISQLSGDVWKYNLSSDTWTQVKFYGPNATGLFYLNQSAFVINDKAYVGLGRSSDFNSPTTLSNFNVYDPIANTWTASVWSDGATFDGAIASSVNGKGYVIGGLGSGNKVMQYDPVNNTWTPKASAPLGNDRYKAATFTIGDNVYLATGGASDSFNMTNDLWSYNTTTNAWAQKASLPSSIRWQSTGFTINGIGYLIGGGLSSGEYSKEVWSYSPSANQWTRISLDYPGGGVLGSFVFVINNKAYFGTGAIPLGGRKKDVWIFDPSLL